MNRALGTCGTTLKDSVCVIRVPEGEEKECRRQYNIVQYVYSSTHNPLVKKEVSRRIRKRTE